MSTHDEPRDCLRPPPDNTPDREQYDRFADYLKMTATPDEDGTVGITEQTYRYLMGDDVPPIAPDDEHPITLRLNRPKAKRTL